ncbi:hypothetical protein SLEP1_g31386 [Rubroshorea leprosula]|uniref:Uncharacterized protein n=1 Tax=Rubroshorea leprosula TaxID=152421 RepID=A0AAV5K800_9ROSI|nr:hypothetical protein SLEP1_g31386 [Rubroshorea leprosula]
MNQTSHMQVKDLTLKLVLHQIVMKVQGTYSTHVYF